jgi:hypothetical protein
MSWHNSVACMMIWMWQAAVNEWLIQNGVVVDSKWCRSEANLPRPRCIVEIKRHFSLAHFFGFQAKRVVQKDAVVFCDRHVVHLVSAE